MDRGTDSVVPRFVDVLWESGNNYGSNGKVLESSARRSFCGRFMGIFYESGNSSLWFDSFCGLKHCGTKVYGSSGTKV